MHPAPHRLAMLAIRLAELATAVAAAGLALYVLYGHGHS